MNIETPYVPTATLLQAAEPFTNFDAELEVVKDARGTELLGKAYFKVTKSFRYYLDVDNRDVWAYVPAGFLTDGASVPKPLWFILPPWGRYGQAAVLHDILCEGKTMFHSEVPVAVSRKKADHIFRDAMKVAGVNLFERTVMFLAVRAWGIFGWKQSKKRMEKKRRLETEYMKQYGTYREPTAILSQVAKAIKKAPAAFQLQLQ